MDYNKLLAKRVDALLKNKRGFSKIELFGSRGYLFYGNLFIAVRKSDILIRVDTKQSGTLLKKKGVKLFDNRGKLLKGWLLVNEDSLKGAMLNDWFETALNFVKTLPKK